MSMGILRAEDEPPVCELIAAHLARGREPAWIAQAVGGISTDFVDGFAMCRRWDGGGGHERAAFKRAVRRDRVAELTMQGLAAREIAERLDINVRTVYNDQHHTATQRKSKAAEGAAA